MAAHGARRVLPMADNAMAIIGIELITAAQGCDFHGAIKSSAALEAVRKLVRERIEPLTDDRYLHTDLNSAIDLVRSGAVLKAAASVPLPSLTEDAA
jgi:histidine ammonia-lyase